MLWVNLRNASGGRGKHSAANILVHQLVSLVMNRFVYRRLVPRFCVDEFHQNSHQVLRLWIRAVGGYGEVLQVGTDRDRDVELESNGNGQAGVHQRWLVHA